MADPVTIGVKLALTAASMALTASQRFEGPRLKTVDVSVADYGTPFPEVDGYCRIDGNLISWSPPLREEEVESKTKGGKYTNYRYFWTGFAVAAGHEIDAIAKIRMDNHLVLDLTKPGPISVLAGFFDGLGGSPVKLKLGSNLRLYMGTETQEIDPTYEAWCEDRYGPDSATARRGVAGAMFVDVPVEKFGNRVPQISMDVVNNPDPAYLTDSKISSVAGLDLFFFSPDFSRFHHNGRIYDTATRTYLRTAGPAGAVAFNNDGSYYDESGGDIVLYSADGVALQDFPCTSSNPALQHARKAGALTCVYRFPNSSANAYYWDGEAFIYEVGTPSSIRHYFQDSAGEPRAVGASGTTVYIYILPTGNYFSVTSSVSSSDAYAFDNGLGSFVVRHGTRLLLVDKVTETITVDVAASSPGSAEWAFNSIRMGTATFWLGSTEYDSFTLDVIRTITPSDWGGTFNGDKIYDPINHAIINHTQSSGALTWLFLDRVAEGATTLASITSAKCLRRGIPSDAIDVTDIPQLVPGYYTIQGTGADQLQPLYDIHDVDCVPHDFGLKFVTRGNAADELIETGDFRSEGGPRFDLSIVASTRLPWRAELNYADKTADHQPNTASDTMPPDAVNSQNKKVFDLTTYSDEPDSAQPKIERYLRRQWFERELGEATLTARWAKLEPGDIKQVEIDGDNRTVRITEITRSGMLVMAKWVRDDPRVHDESASAGPTFDGRDLEEIYIPSPSKAVVADIPLLNDAENDNNPQLHYGVGTYGVGSFPGGLIWQGAYAEDGYQQWNTVESAEKAVWGYAADVLGDANPNLWDRGNSITIELYGTLTSCTEADIQTDPTLNMLIIGVPGRWEIVNFTTASLVSGTTWELSGFLRGRRGTEWAVGLHAVGDEIWLADDLKRDAMGLSDVGQELHFKGQTLGRDVSTAPTMTFEYDAQTLMPYAPARLIWTTDGTDLFGEIIRRTRVGGTWTDDGVVPLSENSEAYEVDILDTGDVVRTITVTGTNTFTYTAAQISADGFTVSSPPDSNTYQMSDAVGRGFALAA